MLFFTLISLPFIVFFFQPDPVVQQPAAEAAPEAAVAAPEAPPAAAPAPAAAGADNIDGLGAAHHALLQREAPTGTQPYVRPTFFPLRVITYYLIDSTFYLLQTDTSVWIIGSLDIIYPSSVDCIDNLSQKTANKTSFSL